MVRRYVRLVVATTLVWAGLSSLTWAQEGDASKGKALFPVCSACHGPKAQGNQAMNAPKLTGLGTGYFVKQMQLFQQGARGAAPGDLQGMQMASMSKGPRFQGEQALADLAAYVDSLPNEPAAATVEGDAAAGAKLYPVCAACHGQKAEGNEAMGGPALAGQSDWYMVNQIKKFKKNQRGYHNADHGGRQMKPMVATLTTDQAINDVIAYINTLR